MKYSGTGGAGWRQIFQGNIFALGLVSFLTDFSTEMIYPLLPVFFAGLRTAPRDALLSESITTDVSGRAFSFHQLMDHAGAVTGPLIAVVFLYLMLGHTILWQQGESMTSPQEMAALRWLFALAALPGMAAVLFLWRLVQERKRPAGKQNVHEEKASPRRSRLSHRFFLFLSAEVLFALGNSSDLFLVFYARNRFGLGLGWVISLWVLLHLAKIVFSLPGGWLADRIGHRTAIIAGWVTYTLVYAMVPFATDIRMICLLLSAYGLYYGLTEGAERALVAEMVAVKDRGRAYGWYHGAVGLATLPASLMFGLFWAEFGPDPAFFFGAFLAAAAVVLLAVSRLFDGNTQGDSAHI